MKKVILSKAFGCVLRVAAVAWILWMMFLYGRVVHGQSVIQPQQQFMVSVDTNLSITQLAPQSVPIGVSGYNTVTVSNQFDTNDNIIATYYIHEQTLVLGSVNYTNWVPYGDFLFDGNWTLTHTFTNSYFLFQPIYTFYVDTNAVN